MALEDTNALAKLMLAIGLVSESQLQEAWEDVGHRVGEPELFLNFLKKKGYITPFQAEKLRKGDKDGYFIGGYRILYKIASGSFGRVYRAEDRHSGQIVALKILRRRWSEDPHTIQLFDREGKLGQSLKHPNIVEVIDVNQDPATGQYYIAMEFVEGMNLRELLAGREGRKLQPTEALRYVEDAAAGIAHAYSRGITHRDMKLTNILISTNGGTAKLVDFGLAGIFSRRGIELEGGEKLDRTVDYAGLEKATGVKAGDVRSDIYFLGCVAYELLTGRSPLEMTKDPRMRMNKNRFEKVEPIRPGEVNAPRSLLTLVERMMMLDPKQRYQLPSQLLEVVREVRKDVERFNTGGAAPAADKPLQRSIFVVEKDERLQAAMRERFKELGYRVFVAADPARAVDRFLLQPFDVLVLDAGTTGDEGRYTFEHLVDSADRHSIVFAAILILSEEQADLVNEMTARPATAVLVRPLTMRRLVQTLQELIPPPASAQGA
jgi:CheY-like chemotaxis protein/tRNA A-37 threonylcarbamoyl transferase component Bud32